MIPQSDNKGFTNCREMTQASNMKPDNIMVNALFRMAMIKRNELEDKTTVNFLKLQKKVEKRSISLAADHMRQGIPDTGSYLTAAFIKDNKVHIKFPTLPFC